jgi:hypothetical protein
MVKLKLRAVADQSGSTYAGVLKMPDPSVAPLVIRQLGKSRPIRGSNVEVTDLAGDQLPSVVEIGPDSAPVNRLTYTTEVRQETTDDN